MKDINKICRTVAAMANQLHKLGYSLSQAFKTAWRRVKESMTCRVSPILNRLPNCYSRQPAVPAGLTRVPMRTTGRFYKLFLQLHQGFPERTESH